MNDMGRFLLAVIAAAAFTMTATSSSFAAFNDNHTFSQHKKFQVPPKHAPRAAHQIVNNRRKKNDFSHLNR